MYWGDRMFHEIEQFVKSKFEDLEKHAAEIAAEIRTRSEYARKAIAYANLVAKLESELNIIKTSTERIKNASSSSRVDSVSIQHDAPNEIYIEKRDLLMQKLDALYQDANSAKQSVERALETARNKEIEYRNKVFS
ncbi:protein esaC [Macrococcus armenti]|uniref:protein esaC n=2 Tax=Macrococcus armenti TaxID=2875764 RepID=UPI001CCCF1ED|nr:protein esaC [Macrococcus armenti]UBH14522.1 protein esaC [Macrococcus armenti]UBH19145.1 protein esaC [Macrococcus armenti]